MLKQGKYKAKIVNYGIKLTKAGIPAPVITFSVDTELQEVGWQGSFKDGKARDICIKALITCGLNDVNKIADLASGLSGGVLDTSRELIIDVIHESYKDKNNVDKIAAKVQWINSVGGSSFKNVISKNEFAGLMGSMGLQADFLRLAAQNPEAIKKSEISIDDIPF